MPLALLAGDGVPASDNGEAGTSWWRVELPAGIYSEISGSFDDREVIPLFQLVAAAAPADPQGRDRISPLALLAGVDVPAADHGEAGTSW